MPEELKPCPFCGTMPIFHPNDPEMVACLQDECPMSDAGTCTLTEWNTRTAPAPVTVSDKMVHDALDLYAAQLEKWGFVTSAMRAVLEWYESARGSNHA